MADRKKNSKSSKKTGIASRKSKKVSKKQPVKKTSAKKTGPASRRSKKGSKKPPVKKTSTKKTASKITTTVKKKKGIARVKKKRDVINKKVDQVDRKALNRGDVPMSVVGHLDEFRSRLMVSVLTILIITLISFFFSDYLLDLIKKPYTATGLKLNLFNLTEGFLLKVKASLIAGLFVGMPLIIYQIWKYIEPAIENNDRTFAKISIVAAVFLFFGGLAFTYFFMLPFAVKMLLSFTPEGMRNMQNASNYLSFVLLFSFGMGLLFEMPIVIMILTRIGILTPEFLIQKRKYAIILIFVVAAMITPPDVLTQLMLGLPLVLLYEISIVISKIVMKRKRKRVYRESKYT